MYALKECALETFAVTYVGHLSWPDYEQLTVLAIAVARNPLYSLLSSCWVKALNSLVEQWMAGDTGQTVQDRRFTGKNGIKQSDANKCRSRDKDLRYSSVFKFANWITRVQNWSRYLWEKIETYFASHRRVGLTLYCLFCIFLKSWFRRQSMRKAQ